MFFEARFLGSPRRLRLSGPLSRANVAKRPCQALVLAAIALALFGRFAQVALKVIDGLGPAKGGFTAVPDSHRQSNKKL